MNKTAVSIVIPAAVLLVLGVAAGLVANARATSDAAQWNATPARPAISLPDVVLTDHHARSASLAGKLAGDDLVVVTFNYTTCQSICGVGNAVMQNLDRSVTARLKRPVRLLSITIDPTVDTPDVLAAAAADFDPSDRWLWVTGKPADIAAILSQAEVKVADIELHDLVFIVGDGKRKQFHRIPSLAPTADDVVAALGEYDL
jgi:protein SCO1